MKAFLIAALLLAVPLATLSAASADPICFGPASSQHCYDPDGGPLGGVQNAVEDCLEGQSPCPGT